MSEKIEVTEYWWEGNDLHTIESGQHFVYKNCVITGYKPEPLKGEGITRIPMTFVGRVVEE